MDINFAEAIQSLGPGAAFRIANTARPPANYLFNTLLPETNQNSYHVDSGTMTVRATMAGLTGMDSPYPPGGVVDVSTFMEKTAKIAIDTGLPEATLRRLQELLMRVAMNGGNTKETTAQEALNFLQKVVVQALSDTLEWMRGQALVTGGIDWQYNNIHLDVDYGVPTANLLTNRTSTAAYDSTASMFWDDWRTAQRLLRYNVRAAIAHPDTITAILDNDANNVLVTTQTATSVSLRRYKDIEGNTVESRDGRDILTILTYGDEGEILDPSNPGQTIQVPFMPTGKILYVGNNNRTGYRVGEGSTDDPVQDIALGYTHLAPTVEGGAPGRWARLFTPQEQPYMLRGQGVVNALPVLEAPQKIVVASTDLS